MNYKIISINKHNNTDIAYVKIHTDMKISFVFNQYEASCFSLLLMRRCFSQINSISELYDYHHKIIPRTRV